MGLDSIKRHLPTREQVLGNKALRIFGEHLRDANLWHFNRRSVARATAIGLFCAYLPMPMEMIPAAFGAILLRANLPLSLAWVWISNPVTWIPLYGPAYLLGTWLLNEPAIPMDDLTLAVLRQQLLALWLGCLLVGAFLAAAGFLLVHGLWRLRVVSLRRNRRARAGGPDRPRA
jgi:uncharacterized protein (DUF2062 family)